MIFEIRPKLSSPVRIEVREGLWLDSRLALWIAAEGLLAVADLHWGYSASHHARGNLLPSWGDDDIAQRLQSLLTDYAPAGMVWVGDTVHAAEGGARAEAFLRETKIPVTLIAGNHDRRWRPANACVASLTRGPYFFHHGDRALDAPAGSLEITGHHHPAVSFHDGAGTRLKLPALVAGPTRLVLPAFSPWAAGTPWNDRLAPGEQLWAIAPSRIFAPPPITGRSRSSELSAS